MSDFPWWFIPAVGAAMAAFIRFLIGVYRLAFGDSIVKGGYSDEQQKRESASYIDIQGSYLKSILREQEKTAREVARMQPEIQCEGCGYFHNLRRCPKCTRTVQKTMGMLYMPPDGGRPEWISMGSANITQTIKLVDSAKFMPSQTIRL